MWSYYLPDIWPSAFQTPVARSRLILNNLLAGIKMGFGALVRESIGLRPISYCLTIGKFFPPTVK
jgi:hypothetical protein